MSSDKSKKAATDKIQEAVDKAAKDSKSTDKNKLSNAAAMDEVRKKMGTE